MKNTINIGGKILNLQEPIIMGIMNFTPDSFHKDSRFNPFDEEFLKKASDMIENGASILDIGGYSTRPGAKNITESEELDRVLPAIEGIRKHLKNVTLSIDTFRKKVAFYAVNSGADIINDISAGNLDSEMLPFVIQRKCPYILMHMRGNPQNMNEKARYKNFYSDILEETLKKANFLRKNGVHDVIIDPGFGFSKNMDQNYDLVRNLKIFQTENYPVLVGVSRKSMIYKLLETIPEKTLEATAQINLQALLEGGKILRVHDVESTKNTIKLYKKLKKQ